MTAHRVLRAVGLTALAAVLIGAMTWLGLWQLGVYDDHQHDDAAATLEQPPVALDDILGPDDGITNDAVGRPVTVTGTYVPAEQFYVRDLDGASDPYAVVTPLLTSTGSAVLVVRGSTAEPDADTPTGTITLQGVLEPSMSEGAALNASRVTDGIRIPALVSSFSHDLYGGYVIAQESTPADDLTAVDPPLAASSRWAGIRNLLYAIQWWVFAGFVAFMWWRIVRETEAAN
jgi:surfeit locus 1 family protein